MVQRAARRLSIDQVSQYERDGYIFPIPALSADEVSKVRRSLETLEACLGGKLSTSQVTQPHLFFRWACDLVTNPTILDFVEDIVGPNILVHTSTLFCKYPNDSAYVSWHQDGHYLRLTAPLVAAWIALSDSNSENGCMRVIPGTHKLILPHEERKHPDNMLLSGLAADVDDADAVDVVLRPGEMSFHHIDIAHGSNPNRSSTMRIGFVIRYMAPHVSQTIPHHAVILARGRDDCHNYRLADKVFNDDLEKGIAGQEELRRWLKEVRGR